MWPCTRAPNRPCRLYRTTSLTRSLNDLNSTEKLWAQRVGSNGVASRAKPSHSNGRHRRLPGEAERRSTLARPDLTRRSTRNKQGTSYATLVRIQESIIAPTPAETSSKRQGGTKGEKEGATFDGVWHNGKNHSPEGTTLKSRPDMLVDPRLNTF